MTRKSSLTMCGSIQFIKHSGYICWKICLLGNMSCYCKVITLTGNMSVIVCLIGLKLCALHLFTMFPELTGALMAATSFQKYLQWLIIMTREIVKCMIYQSLGELYIIIATNVPLSKMIGSVHPIFVELQKKTFWKSSSFLPSGDSCINHNFLTIMHQVHCSPALEVMAWFKCLWRGNAWGSNVKNSDVRIMNY